MREIKFRAWDKEDKKMFTMKDCKNNLGLYFNYTARTYEENGKFVDRFMHMQYTGLNDKNGKDIWEGDILRRNNNNKDLVQVKFGEFPVYEIETEEVIDKAYGWYLEVVITDELSKLAPFCYPAPLNKYWINESEIEVIGNIYEDKLEG